MRELKTRNKQNSAHNYDQLLFWFLDIDFYIKKYYDKRFDLLIVTVQQLYGIKF